MTSTFTRDQVVEEARSWLEVPFRHQGRNRAGLDCAGLLEVVASALGDSVVAAIGPTIRGYSRIPDEPQVRSLMSKAMKQKPRADMKPGDVVQTIDSRGVRKVCHMGIVTTLNGGLGLIHAYNRVGYKKVVEHQLDQEWQSKIVAVFQFHGLED